MGGVYVIQDQSAWMYIMLDNGISRKYNFWLTKHLQLINYNYYRI